MVAEAVALAAPPRPTVAGVRRPGPIVDWWLAGAVAALLLLGLVMVASASISSADRLTSSPLHYFWRQLAYLAVALTLALAVVRTGLGTWQRTGGLLLIFGMVLLGPVLVPGIGREVNGSARWLTLGIVNLQPSELMKLFLILYLAGYLVRREEEVRSVLRGFIKPVAILAIIAGLLLLEPDFGAAVVLFATALGMLFLGGVPLLGFAGWVGGIGVALAAILLAAPYRLERVTTFLNPWADPYDTGFQLTQALIAIGRGEWFGVGLGGSVQKLFYLPEAHTDFVFAIIGEELGFAGMAFVIFLFAFVVWRAFAIAHRAEAAERYFGAYVAYGLGLVIGLQAFTNIGVNLGVLPTKGLPLPLMSYGGSSLVANCVAVGLLLRVDYETRAIP